MTADDWMALATTAYLDSGRVLSSPVPSDLEMFLSDFHWRSGEYFEAKAREAGL